MAVTKHAEAAFQVVAGSTTGLAGPGAHTVE
jgi:hypothetical protein